MSIMPTFSWQRRDGYEVSSVGDKRFSAFYARMSDGRSIECHYQCDIKGYDVGGTNWKLGKGKPPKDPEAAWEAYLQLWRTWAQNNLGLMRDLYKAAREKDFVLSDCFANSPINQAHALSVVLNELCATKSVNREGRQVR